MPPAKRTSRTIWVVVILAVMLPLVGVGLYGLFVGFAAEVQANDRQRVFNVEDLGLIDEDLDRSNESLVRTQYIDGSYDLQYEFESETLYVWCLYSNERSQRDSRAVYIGQSAGSSLTATFEDDMQMVERNDLFEWGDQSNANVLVQDGIVSGYVLNARHGNHVFGVVIAGVEFDEAGGLQSLVETALQRSISED